MMENKLWTVLCALLLTVHLGSTEHGNDHAAASQSSLGDEVFAGAPATDSAPAPTLEPTGRPAAPLNGSNTNTSSSGSLSSNMTKEGEISPMEKNDTNMASPTVSAVPANGSNQTEEPSVQPQTLPSENQTTTSQINSTSQPTTPGPPPTTHNTPVDTTTTNSSNHPTSLPPDSILTSKQPTEPKTHLNTSASTPEPPRPVATGTTATTVATGTTATTVATGTTATTAAPSTQSMSTSSASSTQEPSNTESQTLTSPHTSPRGQATSTTAPSSSSTPQAKAHPDTPSQLNVGGDTTMVHESPTLDPLLAGLVTAFIITAVVITLLLFLKLRRRDNRPEFRRLQDLPMDDMMEDTPLSMYSY